jgi:hypothetical protein
MIVIVRSCSRTNHGTFFDDHQLTAAGKVAGKICVQCRVPRPCCRLASGSDRMKRVPEMSGKLSTSSILCSLLNGSTGGPLYSLTKAERCRARTRSEHVLFVSEFKSGHLSVSFGSDAMSFKSFILPGWHGKSDGPCRLSVSGFDPPAPSLAVSWLIPDDICCHCTRE